MTYGVTFERRLGATNKKLIVVATRAGGDDATVKLYVTIKDPTGAFIVEKDLTVPNAVVTTPQTISWDLPLDLLNVPIRGTYIFEFWEEQFISLPGTKTLNESFTHYFKELGDAPSLAWTETCVPGVLAMLKLEDSGDYSALTVVSRTLTITYPPQEQLADLTTDSTQLTIMPRWTGVDYIGDLDSEYYSLAEPTTDVDVYERYDLTAQKTLSFTCGTCDINSCIAEYARNVSDRPHLVDQEKIQSLLLYAEAYRGAIACGNTSDAAYFSAKIRVITACDCGCDEDATTPQPFDNSLLDELVATEFGPSAWTLITNADLAGSWDTETYPDNQLRYRTIGDTHVEIIGRIASTGLTSGVGSAFLSGYFQGKGIVLQPFMEHAVHLVINTTASSIRFGGQFFATYAGAVDTLTLYPSNDVTPVALTGFAIHAFIPIVP